MATADLLSRWRDVICDAVRADGPDLSMRQWSILLTVYLNPGPHTVRALARDLNVPKPAISRALDALSILGFIKRVRDPGDRRIVLVKRTTDGALYLEDFTRLVSTRIDDQPALGAAFG
ncbi:MAG: MarR family transcriptional regulator [Pseudomonadota bacterium]